MGVQIQPSRADLEKIAVEDPDHINAYIAYFVMEWHGVQISTDPYQDGHYAIHGEDQCKEIRLVPDYVGMMGMDACLDALHKAPEFRGREGPGGISRWLSGIM